MATTEGTERTAWRPERAPSAPDGDQKGHRAHHECEQTAPCGQLLRSAPGYCDPEPMDPAAVFQSLGPAFARSTALQAGATAYSLRQGLAVGQVERPARGVYRTREGLPDGKSWEILRAEHMQRCREFQVLHPGHVASHQTAAAVHGLQIRLHPLMNVHLTSVDRAPCSRRKPGLELHHADSATNDATLVDGLRTTTLARTIADVLRTSRPPTSVALLDAAVRDGLITDRDVKAVLDVQVRWRGRPRALEALAMHDPLRESWLESFSFVSMHELGLPLPRPQVEVLDEGFHFVGRVDGLLGDVFLEADGASKYYLLTEELGITPEESVSRVQSLQDERHERLVELGLKGVRWTTQEIQKNPDQVVGRVWRAVQDPVSTTFRGWLRIDGRILRPERLAVPTSA